MTTTRSASTLSRTSMATLIGATRSTDPRRGSWESQTTSSSRSSSKRAQVSKRSSTAARATCSAPSTGSPCSGLSSLCIARAMSRIRVTASTRLSGSAMTRPSGACSSTPSSSAAASSRSGPRSLRLPTRRAAATTSPEVSSSVIVEVTRSTSSWASSTMSRSCSGSICRPSNESIAMNEWLVTTTSTSSAAVRDRSTKHSAAIGHLLPRHSWADTETCRQARSLTPGTNSSRSPDSVSSAQARSRTTS